MHGNLTVDSLFIGIAVPLVLIQDEVSVRAGIDPDLKVIPGPLGRILDVGADRKDGSRLDIDRNPVAGNGLFKRDAAVDPEPVPEVQPAAFRQIEIHLPSAR